MKKLAKSIELPQIDVAHLLPILDAGLISLLKSLTKEDWERRTIAKLWTVKDVAAHLLDGNVRMLSILRDRYFGDIVKTTDYSELVIFLNQLNADWVKACKRLSPQMLIYLLETTGKQFCDFFQGLPPDGASVLKVDWAGDFDTTNWMEIARQYSEKWLHQQQIRDAVNKPGIMTLQLYRPFINIFMLALPHTFRNTDAKDGTIIKVVITSDLGGEWFLRKASGRWILENTGNSEVNAEVSIDPGTSWKLFSKSLRPGQLIDKVKIKGDPELGKIVLSMVSVMA